MTSQKSKVCVIGAGPSGMSALYNFDLLGTPEDELEVICYEKGSTWLGLWNFSWMTGTDEFGEPCHAGMYKHLWSNGPKECLEYPTYTFDDHFKQAIPSFPPRPVLREYLEGRFKRSNSDLRRFIKWNTVVRRVQYNKEADNFTVLAENLTTRHTFVDTFTHVIVATGIFNVPNKPFFKGIDSFHGRIIHAHDFRNAEEYKGQRLLVVGASYSAEDIALQCLKFGAKSIVTSYRSSPMGFEWPKEIEERPLITRIDQNTIYFKDNTKAEVDSIILCTGYKYHFSFMDDELRLDSSLSLYPAGLYKGSLWLKGGNNKLFYMGTQDQYFTFTMFDVQARWICKYITGQLPGEHGDVKAMEQDEKKYMERLKTLKDCHDEIDFQAFFVADLSNATGYDVKAEDVKKLFHTWEHDKRKNIVTYRDQSFTSVFTKTKGAKHKKWFGDFDDTVEAFKTQAVSQEKC